MTRQYGCIGAWYGAWGVLVITLLAGLSARAELEDGHNVFGHGDFAGLQETFGKPAGWFVGNNQLGHIKLVRDKQERQWLSIENHDPQMARTLSAVLPVDPAWRRLVVQATLRVKNLRPGKEVWHNARVVIRFQDDDGNMVGPYPSAPQTSDSIGWTTFQRVVDVPEEAKVIKLQPGLYFATGQLDIASIRVIPVDKDFDVQRMNVLVTDNAGLPSDGHAAGPVMIGHGTDAAVPVGRSAPTGAVPMQRLTPTRAQGYVHGLWRFQPARSIASNATDDVVIPKNGWGYIEVPGSWSPGSWTTGSVVAQGEGPAWDGVNLDTLGRAWYQRPIQVPEVAEGAAVFLNFHRLSTDADVYLDGELLGRVQWPSGSIDLTDAVADSEPGATHTLSLLVVAIPGKNMIEQYMNPQEVITRAPKLRARGLIGEVALDTRPRGAHIAGLFIRPSVRDRRLYVDVDLAGVTHAGRVRFEVEAIDATGRVAHTWIESRELDTGDTTVKLASDWANPELWDYQQPNLYHLRVHARGENFDDQVVERFGFREFWIDGRQFVLNGKPIRLRPMMPFNESGIGAIDDAIANALLGFIGKGFNLLELWPWDHLERGRPHMRPLWATRADELGLPLMYPVMNLSSFYRQWDDPSVREQWRQAMVQEWRTIRNHPSIVILVCDANRFGHRDDQNPRRIGQATLPVEDKRWQERAAIGNDALDMVRAVDPTRPVTSHHASTVGDLHTINCYLNTIPLQEREEWLSEWATRGDRPLMSLEFGTPFYPTFLRGRGSFLIVRATEPLSTEYAAIDLGPEAYHLESDAYRVSIVERFVKDQEYKSWQGNPALMQDPAQQRLQALYVERVWRAWRTWGVTGGMIPWEAHQLAWARQPREMVEMPPFEPGSRGSYIEKMDRNPLYSLSDGGWQDQTMGRILAQVNGPTLAYIAGKPEAFTEKSHTFVSGEEIRKQAILINDTREPLLFKVSWAAYVGDHMVTSEDVEGELAVGEIRKLPITWTAPHVMGKTDAQIAMRATLGGQAHHDTFPLRLFPKMNNDHGEVFVFDPLGTSTSHLERLGFTCIPWEGEPIGDLPLVVGRNALRNAKDFPGSLKTVVNNAGRVIVMSHDPEWLEEILGFRVSRHVTRQVFPKCTQHDHPVLTGLDAEDLRDWRGAGSLIPEHTNTELTYYKFPKYFWRWGNRGSVTSAAIEIPHRGGWTPLLQCEFDLAYTPLMELRSGTGRLIWSQLDLSARGADEPVADQLLTRLVNYARSVEPEPRTSRTLYMGDDEGWKLILDLGVVAERTAQLPSEDEALVILGDDAPVDDRALQRFVQGGGRVLVLGRREGLPWEIGTHNRPIPKAPTPDAWPKLAGLSISDLRLRSPIDAPLLRPGELASGQMLEVTAGGLLGRVRDGLGVTLFYQMRPEWLNADAQTYLRFSRWRVTRSLSQILANLGARFTPDRWSLDWSAASEVPPRHLKLAGDWQARFGQIMDPAQSADEAHEDLPNVGVTRGWADVELQDADAWRRVSLPSTWGKAFPDREPFDGVVWLRRVVEVPASYVDQTLIMSLGAIDDFDTVYINGQRVGHTDHTTPRWWEASRRYTIPAGLLKAGSNVIAVRVFDAFGSGGFSGPADSMLLGTDSDAGPREFYHPDYRHDLQLGDSPFRYHRW